MDMHFVTLARGNLASLKKLADPVFYFGLPSFDIF
jgi:hypothetical protein